MRMRAFCTTVLSISLLAAACGTSEDGAADRPLGTLREQAELQQLWLTERLDSVLPQLMRQHDVDMWVVAMREYNEDPVFSSLVSPTTFAARRRTIYVFFDRGPEQGLERLALGGSSQQGLYEAVRGTQQAPDGRQRELWGRDQWVLFADMVRERDPSTIAVNISETHNFSDGLSAGEWEQMRDALGPPRSLSNPSNQQADFAIGKPFLGRHLENLAVPQRAVRLFGFSHPESIDRLASTPGDPSAGGARG